MTQTGEPKETPRKTIWEQFVEQKARYVGGTLIDLDDDPLCGQMPEGGYRTVITDMSLPPNGNGFLFSVDGKDFNCAGATQYLGVYGKSEYGDGFALINTFGGHRWDFIAPAEPAAGGHA